MFFVQLETIFGTGLHAVAANDALMRLKAPGFGGFADNGDRIGGASFCANAAIGAIRRIHFQHAAVAFERLTHLERVQARYRLAKRIPNYVSQQFHKTISINS
jgi:hypothetical protein